MNRMSVTQGLDALAVDDLARVAEMLNYTTALALYEQLQRRLLEDGAPIRPLFDDAP